MPTITGSIEHIRMHNAENGYTVLSLRDNQQNRLTAVGHFASPVEGAEYTLEGDFKRHPTYGLQFAFTSVKQELPSTLKGMERYLADGPIKGIGAKTAKRIVDRFGDNTFNVINDSPEDLLEVKGISNRLLNKIIAGWLEHHAAHEIMAFLRGHGIGPDRAMTIYKLYQHKTVDIVQGNPYRLAFEVKGIGFDLADKIAKSVDIPVDSPHRIRAGIKHTLDKQAKQGHVGVMRADLIRLSSALLGASPGLVLENLLVLEKTGYIVIDEVNNQNIAYLHYLHEAESGVAEHLKRLSGKAVLDSNVERVRDELKDTIKFSDGQLKAQEILLDNKLSILTGGPGMGKTTIVKSVVDAFIERNRHLKVAMVAPTGRAAQRMAESTGYPAETVHRLLKFNGSEYRKNRQDPLDYDLLIIDEFSMLGVELMYRTLEAIPNYATCVFIGDTDQLPSVEPGRVLRDMIDSGAIPVAKLTEEHRFGKNSGISKNAHRIKKGHAPIPEKDFLIADLQKQSMPKLAVLSAVVKKLATETNVALRDVQILTPSHIGEMGTVSLNNHMQALVNPNPVKFIKHGATKFGIGDKIIQMKNDYDNNIFNGDLGYIVDIDEKRKVVTTEFDVGMVELESGDLNNIRLAYAVTIHKSQGSEYPAAIIVMVKEHYMMLARNIFYTGITRGKGLVSVVGEHAAINRAVSNNPQDQRFSGLADRLIQEFELKQEVTQEEEFFDKKALAFSL